ncbi:MAG TPA: hypothetical protein VEZ20_10805 [Allosphingosinicella sp.]|nr:hypothetical protein [Allosphingosinicella sp.]
MAQFQYESLEGISSALGTAGAILRLGKYIPHAVTQGAAKVGWAAGGGATAARWAAQRYRDRYDQLEQACQQEQNPYQPTSPRPTGGGGGGGFGGGAVSGGYTPRMDWEWQHGWSTYDPVTETFTVTAGRWVPVWRPIVFDIAATASTSGRRRIRSWRMRNMTAR